MKRAILLQLDATTKKNNILKEFNAKALSLANLMLANRKSKRLMDLHRAMYSMCKKDTNFNSQIICDIERNVVKSKGDFFESMTVKFNVPRNCKSFKTKSRFFVKFGMYPRTYVALPIIENKNYKRYADLICNGWICKTYGLTSDGQIVAFLSKEKTIEHKKNVIGIDINSKCFGVSILTPEGKVLKQLYYGQDIWNKRKKIFERREHLKSLADKGSRRASKSLERLKTKEYDFVKNRIGEVVRDITDLALKHDADIAIEKLRRFNRKGKNFNKQVMRIPFYKFRMNLQSRCFDKGIKLEIVDAYHTSRWCSHCGAVVKGHDSKNYALFKCKNCEQTVNSDRKASLAIAVKSLLERKKSTNHEFFQFSSKRVPVNGLLRSDEKVELRPVDESTFKERHLTC